MESTLVCWSCDNTIESGADACIWCGVWIVELDARAVPDRIAELLPLAKRWGISDDGHRWEAVEEATRDEVATILSQVGDAPDVLWDWLVDEAARQPPTIEYVALTALTMAYDQARHREGGS
jgi:hypothetical protein